MGFFIFWEWVQQRQDIRNAIELIPIPVFAAVDRGEHFSKPRAAAKMGRIYSIDFAIIMLYY